MTGGRFLQTNPIGHEWKRRTSTADLSTGPKAAKSTVLPIEAAAAPSPGGAACCSAVLSQRRGIGP
jgi:hypothetical protein